MKNTSGIKGIIIYNGYNHDIMKNIKTSIGFLMNRAYHFFYSAKIIFVFLEDIIIIKKLSMVPFEYKLFSNISIIFQHFYHCLLIHTFISNFKY